MKLGVFGGTFDPIHLGHLIVAEDVRVRIALDEVLFIPTGQPWLKKSQKITRASHRMAMVELAVEGNPDFRASDMEIERPGPTYTIDTLMELRDQLGPEAELYVMLGTDSLKLLDRWKEPERIFELGRVVAMARPGSQDFDLRTLDCIADGISCKVKLLDGPRIGVSGTELRRRVAEGLSIKYRVPEPVEAYIAEHGLYR